MQTVGKDHGVARSFSDVATGYDAWAEPQRRMAGRLAEMLPCKLPPGPVLDLCCGTGLLTTLLRERYPGADVRGVDVAAGMIELCRRRFDAASGLTFEVADVERFTPPAGCALIASSCGFQWLADPLGVVARMARALAPGGALALSVPVSGSLLELDDCYTAATGAPLRGVDWLEAAAYEAAARAAGLHVQSRAVEPVTTHYGSAWDALRSFKETGATFHRHAGYTPLPVHVTRRLAELYAERFADGAGRMPVTYRNLYLVAGPSA